MDCSCRSMKGRCYKIGPRQVLSYDLISQPQIATQCKVPHNQDPDTSPIMKCDRFPGCNATIGCNLMVRRIHRTAITNFPPYSQTISSQDSVDCELRWIVGADGLWLTAWQNSHLVSRFLEQNCGFLSDVEKFVEQIVGELGEVITSLVFHQIGCKKTLDSHF